MRLASLLLLAALVFGIGFVVVFKWHWVKGWWQSGSEIAQGYTDARSPQEALDLFTKAIKAREYRTAAKYVQGNYAEQLLRAHDAAQSMGATLDKISQFAINQGFDSDLTMTMLVLVDPFPTCFSVNGEPVRDKKDERKAYGRCKVEWAYGAASPSKLPAMNPAVVTQPLRVNALFSSVTLVEETEGKIWKLKIDLPQAHVDAITAYLNKHKAYRSALGDFRGNMTNISPRTKERFEEELVAIIRASK